MTIIRFTIIKDSITPSGDRLTTGVAEYPRGFFHEELLTHKDLSRSVSSSRAIPTMKLLRRVWAEPAVPLVWGKNKNGMQAEEEISPFRQRLAKLVWMTACLCAIACSWLLTKIGCHKQVANRPVEPFIHVQTVLTATNWDNLIGLRAHDAAEPHFQKLAYAILAALNASTPKLLQEGEWHLPFVLPEEEITFSTESLLKFSSARCARVSYFLPDGTPAVPDKDYGTYKKLVEDRPVHASPTEHQGMAAPKGTRSGNLVGWIQHRKLIDGEYISRDPRLLRKEPI